MIAETASLVRADLQPAVKHFMKLGEIFHIYKMVHFLYTIPTASCKHTNLLIVHNWEATQTMQCTYTVARTEFSIVTQRTADGKHTVTWYTAVLITKHVRVAR